MPDNAYYQIRDGKAVPADENLLENGGVRLCYLTLDKLREHHTHLGVDLSVLQDLTVNRDSFRSSLYADKQMISGFINIIDVEDLKAEMDCVMLILKKDLFCLVKIKDSDNSEMKLFESLMTGDHPVAGIPGMLYRYLERLLKGGNKKLESIEKQLLAIEDGVVKGRANNTFNPLIYSFRRQLFTIRNYYEQLVDISTELIENESGFMDQEAKRLIEMFKSKAERLIQGVINLGENLMHLREMLDAALNYNLNNVMKAFTILAAVFLPLTLVVGWYGMNFKYMPELDWPFAYPVLFALCVVTVGLILYYLKRKKLL